MYARKDLVVGHQQKRYFKSGVNVGKEAKGTLLGLDPGMHTGETRGMVARPAPGITLRRKHIAYRRHGRCRSYLSMD